MKKWTTALLLTGVMAMTTPLFTGDIKFDNLCTDSYVSTTIDRHSFNDAYINTLRGDNDEVKLSNPVLENRLRTLLGTPTGEKLKVNSIITNSKYYNESNPTNAERTSLDLSNTGIKDLTELTQFAWPETLVAINLANNGLTNADFTKLQTFVGYTAGTKINLGTAQAPKEITVASNLGSIIKSVNLCFNDLDLTELSTSTLNNEKYLYGIQGISHLDGTKLILNSELGKTKYYFRQNDLNFLSPLLKRNGVSLSYVIGSLKGFTDDGILGEIEATIGGVTSSTSGYYYGWTQTESFSAFTISSSKDIVIERKDSFGIPQDTIINISPEISATYQVIGNPETKTIGEKTLNVRVTASNGLSRVVSLKYYVKDTTAPVLQLVGAKTIYWSKNKAFDYNKYTCIGNDSGDKINESDITRTSNLDVTKLTDKEPYYIKYNYTDLGGNKAIEVIRYVYIQEQALDTINVRCNTQDTTTGTDLTLEVKPDENIPMRDYEGFTFTYKWYVNGNLEYTTSGDFNARSTQSFIFDTIGLKEIKVTLIAKKGTQVIEVDSETLYLDITMGMSNTKLIIIACSVAIILCIAFFSIRVIIKSRRAKSGISKKSSKPSKKSKPDESKKQQITIISGVNPNNPQGFTGGGTGGNEMSRLPDNNNQGNDQMGRQ